MVSVLLHDFSVNAMFSNNYYLIEWRSAFRKITASVVNSYGVNYDFQSVMHYPSNAFAKHPGLETMKSKNGNRQLGNTQGLTEKDIKQVQRMYKCWSSGKKEGTWIIQTVNGK